MTNVQEIYLQLLRKALGFSAPSLHANRSTLNAVDIDSLVHLAQIQGTAPLIYNELLRILSDSPSKDEELIGQLRMVCMQNMMSYEKHIHLLQQVWNALHEAHLHPLLLKGFGLARLYPQPYLRNWGDLDIYVGPDQYHQAAAVLRAAFPQAKHHDEEWEELKHYNFVLPDGLIEMHRSTIKMELPRDKRIYEELERVACNVERGARSVERVESREERLENVALLIPEAKFNMLFTFMHAWYHFVEEGVGFKQIADVALLAHRMSEEYGRWREYTEYMRQNLRKLHLMQVWQLMGYVVVHALGLDGKEWPLYNENTWLRKHGPIFLQRVLAEGIARPKDFGDSNNRYEAREKAMQMNVIARKWMTLKSRFRGAMMIWPYSPQYARHMLIVSLYKGIRRTIKKEKMEVMY